jgi:hypothetical protein
MALFEALTGERARIVAGRGSSTGACLAGRSGIALRKIFEAVDPHVSETRLVASVKRLTEQFEGREMREGDFDWISAIEDDGSFDVSRARH